MKVHKSVSNETSLSHLRKILIYRENYVNILKNYITNFFANINLLFFVEETINLLFVSK